MFITQHYNFLSALNIHTFHRMCVRACVRVCVRVCVCSRLRACLNVSGIVQMRLLLSCFEHIRERQRQREREKFRGTCRTWDVMKGEGTKREDSPNILIKHFFRL